MGHFKIPCNKFLLVFQWYCWYFLFFSLAWWIGCLHSPTIISEKTKQKTEPYWPFYISGAQWCVEDPCKATTATPHHACHQPGHIFLWDGIPSFNQDLLNCTLYSTSKIIPQDWVEVYTDGRKLPNLKVFCDEPGSVGRALSFWRMLLGPRFWRYGTATGSGSHCIETVFNDVLKVLKNFIKETVLSKLSA